MPVYCTFTLNKKTTSALVCSGLARSKPTQGMRKDGTILTTWLTRSKRWGLALI